MFLFEVNFRYSLVKMAAWASRKFHDRHAAVGREKDFTVSSSVNEHTSKIRVLKGVFLA